jgi:hypothetical protein
MILAGKDDNGKIRDKITDHYLTRGDRWERLSQQPGWVYLDLYYLFTRWDSVLGAVKQNLRENGAVSEMRSLMGKWY